MKWFKRKPQWRVVIDGAHRVWVVHRNGVATEAISRHDAIEMANRLNYQDEKPWRGGEVIYPPQT